MERDDMDAFTQQTPTRIGILTSGGDAQGMNAAVRAVVRTALARGAQPYAIYEGWQGACTGGDSIKKMEWSDVSSILAEGGTVIGTARSADFRTYEGRHRAAANLLEHGIDHLVVIGGDGSLSGTNEFRGEWAQHVAELAAEGVISAETAAAHPALIIVGFLMFTAVTGINFSDPTEAIPAYIAILAMPFTYSIAEGISFGIITYTVMNALTGNGKKISALMYILTILFIGKYIFL